MNKYSELVFLFVTPALDGDIKKYSLDEIAELGYKLTIADLTPCLEPKTEKLVTKQRLKDENFAVHTLRTKSEIFDFIKEKSKSAFFFPMFDCYYEVRFVYKLLTEYNAEYGYVNHLLNDVELAPNQKKINISKNRFTLKHLYKAIYNRIVRKLINYKPAKFIAFSGEHDVDHYWSYCNCRKETTLKIFAHSYDYERYKRTPSYNNPKKYCVFLDMYLPFHPDAKIQLGVDIDPDVYFKELNDIFAVITEKTGLEIIIAAHPRADYKGKEQFWGNNKLEYGLTSELVKGASLVLAHYSSSIAFVPIDSKPLLLIKTPTISKTPIMSMIIENYSELLGCSVVESPSEVYATDLFNINHERYDSFLKKYVRSNELKEESLWKYIIKHVSDNYNG